MCAHHNLFKINRTVMLEKIERRDASVIAALIDAIGDQNGWSDETRKRADFLREAGRALIVNGDPACKNAGWVYYGLMLLGPHEQIGDGWKVSDTFDIVEFIERTALCDPTKGLFRGLLSGRDVHFVPSHCENADVVACFISGDEARAMTAELHASDELRDLPDPEMEQVIFNEFSVVLDPDTLSPDECFLILTLG